MALTAAARVSNSTGGEGGVSGSGNGVCGGVREHMFDKVVTPSDVGKLNRLVVPKHFAEAHFVVPGSGGGAALLRFEDGRGKGKAWCFRFSYWGSSQSYVMTKGWSGFVRDRRLAAGDTVSFSRAGHRLFIDCRRRGSASGGSMAAAAAEASRALDDVETTTTRRLMAGRRRVRLFGVDVEVTDEPLDLQLGLN
ncbi:B3 domain-containing protein Os06g0107800 [Brachypodium distachyon]|uniref:TF-B3 domain-containing protein n=1 Tax=Brachypodium distachyon TaxID=15368 RepID=I1H1Z3_BRADI|nr:B3 domain-containing protein Os06g0107800 [Brachypodium distachyon]KQK20030.1 hypothetical protein BRADI_1g52000v3 [Brachypodium distachyon]|eukprot:XP_014751764.1 B3 domain-containing protein Os06g0107800 [Brachypodium distachyon]